MKNKLMILVLAILTTGFFSACKESSNMLDPIPLKTSAGGGSSTAHPALTFIDQTQIKHIWYQAVAVMDSDGTHTTNIYVGSDVQHPCWSPNGKSIAFMENINGIQYLKAIDVSVNSSGVPVGSNVRTLCSGADYIQEIAWCSLPGTGLIAFATYHTTGNTKTYYLYTVSENGGTPTLITSDSTGSLAWPTWSSDDSKLAVIHSSTNSFITPSIRIINPSTGAVLEEDILSSIFSTGGGCEWARSGNTIAFTGRASSTGALEIYYLDYGTANGPYTQHASGSQPTWSPNNATLMITGNNGGNIVKLNAFGTTETTVTTSVVPASRMKWKR